MDEAWRSSERLVEEGGGGGGGGVEERWRRVGGAGIVIAFITGRGLHCKPVVEEVDVSCLVQFK